MSTVALLFSLPPTSKQPVLPAVLWDAKHPQNNEVINCVIAVFLNQTLLRLSSPYHSLFLNGMKILYEEWILTCHQTGSV